ncbi:hypothetical protein QS62_09025 [Gallibacterium salpingitidis]|uniref:Autotransporter domain-containing protein n=2 Tax=Gallibacterium salpingitidis TaxID=505341 RepID=A0A1A7NSN4_9PAST|nr:hypothetical protein QS62_09025 [Gallibacterium salpingitidis]
MESADLMHRYLPVDRCGAQGDNHAWINLLGSWSTQQADGKRSGYDANHQGIAMGSDRCFTENVKLGIYASAVHSKADSRGIADKHQMKANSWQVGLYGNAITSAKTDIEAYIGVGKAEIDGKRYTQLNQKLAKSDYNADMMSAGMGVNYHLSDAITPFLRLDYTRIGADSYHETGAELMNLTVKGQTSEALIARTGVKFDKAVTDKLSLYAKASVGVDLLHREQAITAAFSALPTNTFSVKNGKFGRVIGDIELGSTYHFTPNVSLQFGGQAIGREGSHSLGVQANFNIRF